MTNDSKLLEGVVIETLGPVVFVRSWDGKKMGEKSYACSIVGRKLKRGRPVTGDHVIWELHTKHAQNKDYQGVISQVLPRKSLIQRLDPHSQRPRPLVANLDTLVVVASVGAPLLKPGLIDRYLVSALHSQIEPIICFSKWEFAEELDLLYMRIYQALGYTCLVTSAVRGDGIDALKQSLHQKASAFLGHSGVGKSSLLNCIFPDANLAVGALSTQAQRGRHTTSTSRLLEFDEGGFVIDTPGVREFGITGIPSQELSHYFPEFHEFAETCRFQPCSHTHEPQCGVLEALQRDDLPNFRYESYLKIYEELQSLEKAAY